MFYNGSQLCSFFPSTPVNFSPKIHEEGVTLAQKLSFTLFIETVSHRYISAIGFDCPVSACDSNSDLVLSLVQKKLLVTVYVALKSMG